MPTCKRIVGAIFEEEEAADPATVKMVFPSRFEVAEAIAALAWAACGQNRRAFRKLLSNAGIAADRMFVAKPNSPSGGRPARNWEEDYGKSAWQLELGAVVRFAASRARQVGQDRVISKAEARRQSLTSARLLAGRHRLSGAKIALDAERLKQAIRSAGMSIHV